MNPKYPAEAMIGFSPEFRDPEHYIIDITERIWDAGGVGLIEEWYSADCPVHTPYGTVTGVSSVINATLARLQEFPEGGSLHEDVIIGLKPEGFYSSHRPRSMRTHLGNGQYGVATGTRVNSLGIADCLCVDNQIVDEWLVRDQAGIAKQMGLDVYDLAKNRAENALPGALERDALLESWKDPNGMSLIGDADIGKRIVEGLTGIWEDNRIDIIHDLYDRSAVIEAPVFSLYRGTSQIMRYFSTLMSAFQKRTYQVHHVIVRQEANEPITIAFRWSIGAEHSGPGEFGIPTGCPVAILGITHVEMRRGKIIREWTAFDSCSIQAQIEYHRSTD